jgi:peptidoglycan/LPS O-acetylase OafA/YrhL
MKTLADRFDPRRNSLTFLRVFMAGMVVYAHSYPLGVPGIDFIGGWQRPGGTESCGSFAVDGFFALSGFLVVRSYAMSRSLPRYLWHRFLRIMPGYWVCLVVTALAFGPLMYWIERHTLHGYLTTTPDGPYTYVVANKWLRTNQWGIHGLLSRVDLRFAINGSLWTLEHEAKCYLVVAVAGVLFLFTRLRFLGRWVVLAGTLFLAGCVLRPDWIHFASFIGDNLWVTLAAYFFAGASFYLFAEWIPIYGLAAAACVGVTAWALWTPWFNAIAPFTWSYVLFWAAVALPMHGLDRYGDYSYGLYIYAFPVQQTLALLGLGKRGIVVFCGTALVITLLLAAGSYWGVERPFLRLKNLRLRAPWRKPATATRSAT